VGSWQLQHAKARFSEFLNAALKNRPQVVTRRGGETAVLVPIEEWRRMQQSSRYCSVRGRALNCRLPPQKWKRRLPIDFRHPDFK
jgi:prevent-host-death family protein